MAKIFFENKFLLTRKLHKQYCKKMYRETGTKTKVICIVLMIVCLAAAAGLYIGLNMLKLPIVLVILALYFLMMAFIGYTFSEWLNFGKLRDEHSAGEGLDVVIQVSFEPMNVVTKFGKTGFTFKYSTIEKAYETEDLIILVLNAKGMIRHTQIIFKKGFTDKDISTLNRFRQFINEKTEKVIFEIDESVIAGW